MIDMASPSTADRQPPASPLARRLLRLMKYLGVDEAEFARRAHLSAGYVNRLLSGERGTQREPAKLYLHAQMHLGIADIYWRGPVEQDPEKCKIVPSKVDGRSKMGVMVGGTWSDAKDLRREFADIAAEHDDPPEVVKGLLRASAPADADAGWWLRKYLELRDATEEDATET